MALSLQARLVNHGIRVVIRRRQWGSEQRVTRRARRLFGAPPLHQWLRTRDVTLERVTDNGVHGEWVIPEASEPGVILYFHGGGYVSGSPATHRPITAALARLSRFRVFAPKYRRAPEHRFPAALDDAVAAYQWLLGRGLSSHSIALAGDSAGGGLVLSTMVRARTMGLPLPACAVCFSPWTDLVGTGASMHTNDGHCAMFRPENITEFATIYLGSTSPSHPEASPLLADLSGLPPVLFQVGSTELLLDDAQRVHRKIQDTGGVSHLAVFDGVCHCWQMFDGIMPEARTALTQATSFIRSLASS